jgi:hypothetical protein
MADVALRFGASDDGLTAQFRKVDKQLDQFQASTNKVASNIGRGFSNLGAIVGGISFAVLIKESLALADSLEKASAQTGIGVEALQKLQFVAAQSSVSFESVSGAVNRLQKALVLSGEGSAEATAGLNRLGLSVEDVISLAPDQQFLKVAEAIRSIEDPAQQTAAAMGIFGRSGAELLPLLKQTAEEAAGVDAAFSAMGGAISGDTTKSVDALGDSLGNIKTATISLGVELLGLVDGPLTAAANEISQVIGDIRLLAGGGTEIKKLEKQLQLLEDAGGSIPVFLNFGYIDGSPTVMGPDAIAKKAEDLRRKIVELTLAGQGVPGISIDTPSLLSTASPAAKAGKALPAELTPAERRLQDRPVDALNQLSIPDYTPLEIAQQAHLDEMLRQTVDFSNKRFEVDNGLQALLATSREQFGLQEINYEELKAASIFDIAGGLFSALASQNEAFAKVQQGIAVAQAVWYTSGAVTRALRDVPFPANFGVAAKIAAAGAIQIAKIKSTSFKGGGGAASGGLSIGGAGSSQATLPDTPAAAGATAKAGTTIYINGMISRSVIEDLVDKLKDEVDRDVTIFGSNSRQALDLYPA